MTVQMANTYSFPFTTQMSRLSVNFMTRKFKTILEISMSISAQTHLSGFAHL